MPTATACRKTDLRAFEYFSEIANTHADESPGTPQARFVANAFVALGHYYLDGIPNSTVKPNPDAGARDVRLRGVLFRRPRCAVRSRPALSRRQRRDAIRTQAARWLQLAANKGQYQAQALLGDMLFKGQTCAAAGGARPDVADARQRLRRSRREPGSSRLYDNAFTPRQRRRAARMALVYLEGWLEGRRD